MYFFVKYVEPHKDPEKPYTIKRLYNNYKACENCKSRNKCCSLHKHTKPSQNMVQKCKKQWTRKWKNKNKDKFAKKPSVEGPFGIFKEQFQIEKEVVRGMIKTEERINLDVLAYNLIRLYKIKQEIVNQQKI